jgi:hypothetical protein
MASITLATMKVVYRTGYKMQWRRCASVAFVRRKWLGFGGGFFLSGTIPIEGALQAFFQADSGFVA